MGLTKLGNKDIIKKMFGNKEILKEVCNGITVYEKETKEYFITFYSANRFSINIGDLPSTPYWDGTIEYSTDKVNWTTWSNTRSSVNAASDGVNYNLYLRGNNNTIITGSNANYSQAKAVWYISVSGSGRVNAYGDMTCLLDWQKVKNGETVTPGTSAFRYMFYGDTKLRDVSNLIMPTTLSNRCCYGMFWSSKIINTPKLPALTVPLYAYAVMFASCANLYTFQGIDATTVADHGCYQMFSNCSTLTVIEKGLLITSFTGEYALSYMFINCTSIATLFKLNCLTLTNWSYENMYRGCSLIKLSSTQTGEYQTAYRVPTSGTPTTGDSPTTICSNMFTGTGGTLTAISINITYYTSNTVI